MATIEPVGFVTGVEFDRAWIQQRASIPVFAGDAEQPG